MKGPEFGAGPKSYQVQVNGFCRVFQVFLFALDESHQKAKPPVHLLFMLQGRQGILYVI